MNKIALAFTFCCPCLFAPITDLLITAAGERIINKQDQKAKVPFFDNRLPDEIKDHIVGYMLKNALKTLPDMHFCKKIPVNNFIKQLAWNPDGTQLAVRNDIWYLSCIKTAKRIQRAKVICPFLSTGKISWAHNDVASIGKYMFIDMNTGQEIYQAGSELFISPSHDLFASLKNLFWPST